VSEDLWPLPSSWTWASFREVADIELELVHAKRFPAATHIAPNHIESGTGRLLETGTVRGDNVAGPKHRFAKGEILYSKIRPYLAKAVIAPCDGYCSSDMYPVRCRFSSEYLLNWLVSPAFTHRVARDQSRTVLPKVNLVTLNGLPVPIAPLNEQRRIVAKLEALQARSRRAREALDAVPPLLEKLRQSILAAAFRGDLTKDWRAKHKDVEPPSELLKRIRTERRKKWEETELAKMKAKSKTPTDDKWKAKYKEPEPVDATGLPALPEGWCWSTFETVAEVDLGRQRAPQYQTGRFTRPYLRVANIKDDRIDFSDVLDMDFDEEDFEHYQLTPGDILLSEGQSPELVGQSAIYEGGIDGLCFQKTLHRFRAYPSGPSSLYAQLVFRHYLRSGVFRSAMRPQAGRSRACALRAPAQAAPRHRTARPRPPPREPARAPPPRYLPSVQSLVQSLPRRRGIAALDWAS